MASLWDQLSKKSRSGVSPLLPSQAPPVENPASLPNQPPNGLTLPTPPGVPAPNPNAPGPGANSWNTNGYAQPNYTASNVPQFAPSGWDQTKWADPNHQSPKYAWGRIYASNPNTPEGRANMIAQLQQAYPGVTFNGKDLADFSGVQGMNGIGQVDLFQGAGDGTYGISWRDIAAEAAQAAQQGQAGGGNFAQAGAFPNGGSGGSGGFQSTGNAQLDQILQGGLGLPGGAFGLGPSQFDDHDTMRLFDLINSRLAMLTTPQEDPSLTNYLNRATGFANDLNTPYQNPQMAQTQSVLQQILNDVQGKPFSDSQSAALQAQATDQLERDRAAATHRTTARMAGLGHGAGSGTIQQAIGDVDREYDNHRGLNQRAITLAGIDQINRNRQTATSTAQLLSDLTGREQALNEGRKAQGLGILDSVVGQLRNQRNENEARLDKALPLASIPLQLGDQRLQAALQVLGLGGQPNPQGIFSSLAQLSAQTQANNIQQNANNSQFWLGLGQAVAGLPWGQWFKPQPQGTT